MSVFEETSYKAAYQEKSKSKRPSIIVEKRLNYNMSKDRDDLKSIKVYKFDNTKESWHEFALSSWSLLIAGGMRK